MGGVCQSSAPTQLPGARYGAGMASASFEDLERLGLEVATCLWLDVGRPEPVQSSAKITERYEPADLIGRQVVVVTGFDPIRVGGFRSDVLVLAALDPEGVRLLRVDGDVEPGTEIA